MTDSTSKKLVLASGSPYRKALLARLGMPFTVSVPGIDETALPGERPADLVLRLAREKARHVARERPDALVIGSDQIALRAGEVLGKPGGHEAAVEQLLRSSGLRVEFHTAVALMDDREGLALTHVDVTTVQFRSFDRAAAERYLQRERAYDCAGAFKAEGLGIALFSSIRSDDPTALTGLPLIWLCGALERAGMPVI